jgi:hypothetical protein
MQVLMALSIANKKVFQIKEPSTWYIYFYLLPILVLFGFTLFSGHIESYTYGLHADPDVFFYYHCLDNRYLYLLTGYSTTLLTSFSLIGKAPKSQSSINKSLKK